MLLETLTTRQGRYNIENGFVVSMSRPARFLNMEGVKAFEGRPVGTYENFRAGIQTATELRERFGVWRAEETVEASNMLADHGKLLVVGSPQSGKGTIMYGLTSICDTKGIGQLLIDGHWQESSAETVVEAIQLADQKSIPIFFDSADYLFLGSRKFRRLSKLAQAERTGKILEALSQAKTPVILTMHDQFWMDSFLDKELLEKHQKFFEQFPIYNLSRQLSDGDSVVTFLVDHGYSPSESYFIQNMAGNPLIQNLVTKPEFGDKKLLSEIAFAVNDYPALKILARERQEEVRATIAKVFSGNQESVEILVNIILESLFKSDFETSLRSSR